MVLISRAIYLMSGRMGTCVTYGFDPGAQGAQSSPAIRRSVFTLYTSWLATPFFHNFNGPQRETGGAGNTKGFSNWAVSLDCGGFLHCKGFVIIWPMPINRLIGSADRAERQFRHAYYPMKAGLLSPVRRCWFVVAGAWSPVHRGWSVMAGASRLGRGHRSR